MFACICMYVYVCMYMCACICMYMYVCICMCVCMCVYVCVYICMYVYVCLYAYMYMYVCIIYWKELPGGKCPTQNGRGNCPGELSGGIVLHPEVQISASAEI